MTSLTPRQRDFLDFIKAFGREHGYAPTVREIGAHFGIESPNGTICHLRALMKKGYLTRDGRKARTLKVA